MSVWQTLLRMWPAVLAGVPSLALLVVAACFDKPPEKYRSFFSLPLQETDDSLLTYPIDDQVEIYLWGMTNVHPPLMHLAEPLAKNGPTAVEAIRDRLQEQGHRDYTRFALIYALEWIACDSPDLTQDTVLITQLRVVISNMRPGHWKDRATEALQRITGDRSCTVTEEEVREELRRLRTSRQS